MTPRAVDLQPVEPFVGVFGNVGRDKDDHHSTRWADTDAIEGMFDVCPADGRWAAFFAEIREGDDNNELALIRRLMPNGAALYCPTSREPMVLGPAFGPAKGQVLWVPRTSVKHWSPLRSVNRVRLLEEPLTFWTYHHAAGAHGQGDRPAWARPLLDHSWDALQARKEELSNAERAMGRNQFAMVDVNDLDWPRQAHEVTAFHDRTDWGRARPAPGYEARFKEVREIVFRLDSHDGHKVKGGFPVADRVA